MILYFVFLTFLFTGLFIPLPKDYVLLVYLAIVLLFYAFNLEKIGRIKNKKNEIRIINLVFMTLSLLFVLGRFWEMNFLYCCILFPAIVVVLAKIYIVKGKTQYLLYYLSLLIVVNLLISYYERVTQSYVLYSGDVIWESTEIEDISAFIFRATGLFGHPLQNAMIMSMMMSIFLVLQIDIKYKVILWVAGFISLLCFNGRGAIIVSVMLLLFYIFFIVDNSNRVIKALGISILGICFYALIMLIIDTPLAGRLVTGELMEGNGSERLRVWLILTKMDFFEYIVGITHDHLLSIQKSLNLYTMENWIVIFMIRMGIPIALMFIISYVKLMWNLLNTLQKSHKVFLVGSFFLLSSLNNSIAVSSVPLTITLLSFYVLGNNKYVCRLNLK